MASKDHPFGSGIGLDEDFDLKTDETGDLAVFTGTDELEKDLSLLVSFKANSVLGLKFSEQDKAKVRVRSRKVLEQDPRVADVSRISVRPSDENPDSALIEATILTMTGATVNVTAEA